MLQTINESKNFMANYTNKESIALSNEQLVQKCKEVSKDSAAYNRYYSSLYYKTSFIITSAARGYENADEEELIHFFSIALLEAIEKYEEGKGASFSTFLYSHYRRKLNPKLAYIKRLPSIAAEETFLSRGSYDSEDIMLNINSTHFLTKKEKMIMAYISAGYKVKEILDIFNFSQQTLYNNIKRIKNKYKKYNVSIYDSI